MDPLSISASTLTLLHLANKIGTYLYGVYRANDERAHLKTLFDDLDITLKTLDRRVEKAKRQPDDACYQGALALIKTATPDPEKNGRFVPDASGNGDGLLVRLRKVMEQMVAELEEKDGINGGLRRLKWPRDKNKFQELIKEITTWKSYIDSIFDNDHFELSLSIRVMAKDTNVRVQQNHRLLVDYEKQLSKATAKIELLDEREIRREEREAKKELDAERQAIIHWLSKLDFRSRHNEIYKDSFQTGQSLLKSAEFGAWKSGRPWRLLCYGMPGSGKTVLASIIIEQLRSEFKSANLDIPVLCMYLEFKKSSQQSFDDLMGSLLRQLIEHRGEDLPSEKVRGLFRDAGREVGGARPKQPAVLDAIKSEIASFQRVILVLDAIDEAAPEVNQNLWETLDDLQIEFRTKKLDKFSILVTSRPVDAADYYIHSGPSINCSCCGTLGLNLYKHCDYCRGGDFDICQDCINAKKWCDDPRHELVDLEEEVRVDIEATEGEIRDYVTAELEHELKRRSAGHRDIRRKASTRGTTPLGRLLQEYPEIGEKIKRVVPVRADRMFMLARLYMTTLRMKPGWMEVNDALEHLPHGYVGVYEDTMRRIVDPAIVEPSSADLARRALMWVVCAQKPLTLKQLQDALTKTTDLRLPYRHSEATLLEKTAGLIQIHGTVNPIHLTAFEYLRDSRDRWFPNASAEMALVCMQYLSQVVLREPCQGLREDQEFNDRITEHPLAAYAYQHWGDHVLAAESRSSIHVAVMDFLSDEDRVAAMSQAMWYLEESGTTSWSLRKGASALHICAWFGLAEVMADLVESGIPADIRDISFQQSPLMLACSRGNRAAVIELTLSGADINATDSDGCDALYEAVKHSHSAVVSFLVSTGRLINKAYTHVQQRTALMIAAESGDAEIVEHLLQSSSTHINQKDAQGFTALALACRSERLNIVNGLLSCPGIDINARNSVGATCLHIAADSGNLLIVKTLLMRGIKHDVEDSEGRATAIARAVDNGSQAMLQIFVEHHVQISCRDERGRGLLHAAAINGHHSLLPYLVERGLDPNITDDQGRTPLHDAARLVDPTTARVLCDIKADPTKRDNIGRLPSTIAWENGHERVRDLLDERLLARGIPPVVRNMAELPLWAMVKAGQAGLLEDSLSRSENVSSEATRRDPDTGNSGLHYAASITELIGILKFLLDKKVFPLSEPNFISRTPLHMAVLGGNLDGCRALLEAGAAAEPADRWGSTAVQMACARNQWEIALLLIEEGADTAQCQIPLTTLLFTAVEYGKPKVVETLIDEGANVSVKNLYGQSPLQVAIAESNKRDESGQYEEIMHLLRQNKSNYERPILAKHVSAPTAFPQPDEAESDDKIMPLSTTFSKPKLADIADVQHIKKRVTF